MSPSSASIPAPNRPSVGLATIHDAQGAAPWTHRLIENPQSYGDLLCERPGSASAPVWRPNADEFVAVLEGRYEVEIEELGTFSAEEDTFLEEEDEEGDDVTDIIGGEREDEEDT